MRVLSVDEILHVVGEFDRFQWTLDAILCVMIIPRTYMILIMYFAALKPEWKCVKNSTVCLYNTTMSSSDPARCSMPRSEWEFTEPKEFSIVTEFDIYCDREWTIQLTTSISFVGWAMGAIILGWVADTYGRKKVLFPAEFGCISLGLLSIFMPNIELLIALRFLIGFLLPGVGVQSFILISEFVGSKRRPLAGIVLWFFFAAALCLQGMKAYFIRQWKVLFMVCTLPYIFVFLFWKFVPESVRWLRLKGRTEEAMAIFRQIGVRNKRPLPEDVVLSPVNQIQHKANPLDLFRTLNMAKKSIVQGFAWLSMGMVYYGLSLASSDLGGSLYRNYVLLSAVEFPAVVFAVLGCDYFGRKKIIVIPCFIGSVACIIIGFISRNSSTIAVRVTLGMLSKLLISTSFDAIYTWSVEIYPTSIRSVGMGYLQIVSRIGAASSPWVAKSLQPINMSLPFYVMGGLTLLSSLLCCLLPETKGRETAETNQDAENQGLRTASTNEERSLELQGGNIK